MRRLARIPAAWLLPLVLVTSLVTGACRRPEPLNLLLVTFDTTRSDRLGCYGNSRIQTPTLDHLADTGVRFANTMAAAPITMPSHTTILTGRYPTSHGIRDNGLFVLGEEQLTLAEILRDKGYATAGAVGSYPLIARFGLDQGFDLFDDHLNGAFEDYLGKRATPKERLFFDERRAAQVNEAVVPWITEHAREPFFVWVHYFDPHQPFEPAPPFDQVYADEPYDGEIAYADSCLGFLLQHLESLGVLDRTLVVMTADHGEGLGEHNEETHAVLGYNSTLHVPLIVRPPAGMASAGRVVEQRVGTVDIVPTVLELLGVELPGGLQGHSLVPLLGGDEATAATQAPPLYAENLSPRLTHGWGELRILFEGNLKYIHGPRPELFDLEADPAELRNLAGQRPDEVGTLRATLEELIETTAVAGVSRTQELDDEVRQRLEALGYLHQSGTAGEEIIESLHDGGIAPQDRVGDVNDLSAAKHLLFKGRPAEALAYTERLTRGDSRSPLYLELHASALVDLGRLEEAWAVAQRLDEQGSIPKELMLRLTASRFEHGQKRSAVDSLRTFLDEHPSAQAAWLLASLHQELGEPDEGRAALVRALEIEPTFVPARVDLAVRYAESGDEQSAEREFLAALEDAPYYPKAHYNYGTFVLRGGRPAEAAGYFARAIALSPRYLRAHLALVAAHVAAGDYSNAEHAESRLRRLAPGSREAAVAAELMADCSG